MNFLRTIFIFKKKIISEQNQVYTFGKGTDGQLGHGDRENQLYPKMIELLVDLKAIYGILINLLSFSVKVFILF